MSPSIKSDGRFQEVAGRCECCSLDTWETWDTYVISQREYIITEEGL